MNLSGGDDDPQQEVQHINRFQILCQEIYVQSEIIAAIVTLYLY